MKKFLYLALLFIIALFSTFKLSNVEIPVNSPSLAKEEAISIANNLLLANDITLPEGYNDYAFDDSSYPSSSFIWQELGEAQYHA